MFFSFAPYIYVAFITMLYRVKKSFHYFIIPVFIVKVEPLQVENFEVSIHFGILAVRIRTFWTSVSDQVTKGTRKWDSVFRQIYTNCSRDD
jgi:hypothetical protein